MLEKRRSFGFPLRDETETESENSTCKKRKDFERRFGKTTYLNKNYISENRGPSEKNRKEKIMSSHEGRSHVGQRTRSKNKLQFAPMDMDDSFDDDVKREIEKRSNNYITSSRWIKVNEGIERFCEKEVCDLTMNSKARKLRKKIVNHVDIHEESQEDDGNDSGDSDPEIEPLDEESTFGLRRDYKSNSRSNKGKRAKNHEEYDEYGDMNVAGLHIREDMDAFRCKKCERKRKGNASPQASRRSFKMKTSTSGRRFPDVTSLEKKIRRSNEEYMLKVSSQTKRKWSKVKKTFQDTSSDNDAGNDDLEEDFKVEDSYSSDSEPSLCSLEYECNEEEDSRIEITGRKGDELGNQETNSVEHVLKDSGKNREKGGKLTQGTNSVEHFLKDSGKNREKGGNQETNSVEHVLKDSGKNREKGGKLTQGTTTEGSCRFTRVGKNAETYEAEKFPCKSAVKAKQSSGEREIEKVEDIRSSKQSKPIHSEEDSDMESEACSMKKSLAEMKKRKRTWRREGNEIRKADHADCSHEGESGLHDQTCFEPTCDETNKSNGNLKGEKVNQNAKREQFTKQKHKSLLNVLVDSIMGKDEVFEEKANEQEETQPSSKGFTLPRKFRFEDEEPKTVEKSEEEIMVEGLFSELALAYNEDLCVVETPEGNKIESSSNVDPTNVYLCHLGKHDLTLDDEIGLVCRHCFHVEREYKYIDPEFAPKKSRETWIPRYGDWKKFSMLSGLDFSPEQDNFGDSFNASNGTVWDIIPGLRSKMYQHQQEGFEILWKNLEGTIDLDELKNNTDSSSQIGGCIISHAPGTGKTLLTIAFIATYLKLFPGSRPVIIAPAGMLLTWEEEFKKWGVEFPFHNLSSQEFSGKEDKKLRDIVSVCSRYLDKDLVRLVKIYSWSKAKSILGVSYNLYQMLAGQVHRKGKGKKNTPKVDAGEQSKNYRKILLELPRLVVLDEGHNPRNEKSLIWNTLLKLQTKRRIILTGTPFQNNFGELFNTLHLVRPAVAEILAKERAFVDMIAERGMYSRKQRKTMMGRTCFPTAREEVVDKPIEKLKAVLAPFVHIHKGNILQSRLPGLRDTVILLNPPPMQKELIELIDKCLGSFEYDHKVALITTHPSLIQRCSLTRDELSKIDPNASKKTRPDDGEGEMMPKIDSDALRKARLDPKEGAKTRFVMELVRLSLSVGEKVLVFSQYIHPLELIGEHLKECFGWEDGRHVLLMRGKQDQKHRQQMMAKFNDPKSEAVVMLASSKCCSEGINLVGASRVVLLDVLWNPSVERQAICRAYRLGQQKIVHAYHLMAAGTTEGDKYCRQAEKDRLSELVFSSSTNENEKQKNPASSVLDDFILQHMIGDARYKDLFEKIICQPKEANLIESFGLASRL